MYYMNKLIKDATSEELLHCLLHVNGVQDGPSIISFGEPTKITAVGIGSDASADVIICGDDITLLNKRIEEVDANEYLGLYGKGRPEIFEKLVDNSISGRFAAVNNRLEMLESFVQEAVNIYPEIQDVYQLVFNPPPKSLQGSGNE